MTTPSIDIRLADWRERAAVLRHTGHPHDAELIEKICDEFGDSLVEYMTYVNEDDAMRRSSKARRWLRQRFAEWSRAGHAKLDDRGRRLYRLCVLPVRPNLSAARDAGFEAGRGDLEKAS
jgi:hypothetical protein